MGRHLYLFLFLLFNINSIPSLATPPTPKIYSISYPYTVLMPGQEVFLRAYFSDPDTGESYSIKWDMGDGRVREVTLQTTHDAYANPGRCSPYRYGCFALLATSHAYSEPGSYDISLIVTDSRGETGTEGVSLSVLSPEAVLQRLSSALEKTSLLDMQKEVLVPLEMACSSRVGGKDPGKDPESSNAIEAVMAYLSKNRSASGGLPEEIYKTLESLANYLSRRKK